jgi:hypothetical protein
MLTPEETLRTILQAYVTRDLPTVLSYRNPVIKSNPERAGVDAYYCRRAMTDRLHLIRVGGVSLEKVVVADTYREAFLTAEVETTPGFPGPLRDGMHTYRWALKQFNGTGPWYFDGGGW